jgi:hypothetical protein
MIVKMIVEKQMECRIAGETKVLGENLPQRHFCPSQNPTLSDPDFNPGRRGGKKFSLQPSDDIYTAADVLRRTGHRYSKQHVQASVRCLNAFIAPFHNICNI